MRMAVGIPPSVLPDISPSRGEIGWGATVALPPPCGEGWRGVFLSSGSVLAVKPPSGCRHLPHKGGDDMGSALQPLSPLEGEMPGRAEGGMALPGRSYEYVH
jgi:hypothetical protein